jgi:site-specific recombinase XerD
MSTQPTSRAPYSLHNILETIESSATLTPRQRQDQASAIRTVARLLGNTPAGIPANPQLLARRLDEIAPARHNLSPGRWANIRSLLRAALATVTTISPGRQQNHLTPDWAAAAAMLPPRLHHPLSKMMHFFAGQGVAPHQVDAVTLEGFAAFLDASLLAKPKAALNDSRAAWNRACRDIQNWPGTPLPVPPRQDHYGLPWSAFPSSLEADCRKWLHRLGGSDLLDDRPFAPVRPATLRKREQQIRCFASALVCRGVPAEDLRSLADLVSLTYLKEGLRFHLDRRDGTTSTAIADLATTLKAVARHWVKIPEADLQHIEALRRRLECRQRGLTAKNRERLRALDDPANTQALVNLPQRLMALADKTAASSPLRAARLARDAVAIELLLMAPLRVENLAMLDLEQHLLRPSRTSNLMHIIIPGKHVKNHDELEYPLPAASIALLQRYLQHYRPSLALPGSTALFPALDGGAKTGQILGQGLSKRIFKHTGLRVNPHLFRHIAAKFYLGEHPGGYEAMRRVLGHRSIATTTSFYTGLETAAAVRHFDKTILGLRQGARP